MKQKQLIIYFLIFVIGSFLGAMIVASTDTNRWVESQRLCCGFDSYCSNTYYDTKTDECVIRTPLFEQRSKAPSLNLTCKEQFYLD